MMTIRKIWRRAILALAFVLSAHSADLVPELATSSNLHKANSTSLLDQKSAALEVIRKPYLAALETADRNATTAGNVAAVRAIGKEREAATKGEMAESLPPDLPKSVASARKTFFRGFEKIGADFAQKQKVLDTAYLRTLAALQAKGGGNPILDEQIKVEKARLLIGIHGPLTDLRNGLEGTKWKDVKTGEMHHFREGKLDGTWRFEPTEADKVRLHWNEKSKGQFTLSKDGKKLSDSERVWEIVIQTAEK